MKYWLMKSEPSEYSISDLEKDKREMWDGIRNYQVRNMIRDKMRVGDKALFYHSNAGAETGVAGVMKIASKAYPDPTQFDPKSLHPDPKSDKDNPRWYCVDVAFVSKLPCVVGLAKIKELKVMQNSPLLRRGNRLSIIELTKEQYNEIIALAK